MKKILALALTLLPATAFGQGAIHQNGSVTQYDVPRWAQDRTLEDAGGLTGNRTRGVNPFSVTDFLGLGECFNSNVTNGAYSAFCLGHDSSGNGLITLDSYNGAATGDIYVRRNGVTSPLFGPAGGTTVGLATVPGADPTGATDSTAAFATALAAGGSYLVCGTYKISSTLTFSVNSTYLVGCGRDRATFTSTSTNLPMFVLSASQSGMSGLTLTRSVTPLANGDGIQQNALRSRITLTDLQINNQYHCLNLSGTDISWAARIDCNQAVSDGVVLTGEPSDALQWRMNYISSQKCGGDAFRLNVGTGVGPISTGPFDTLESFACTGHGFAAYGTNTGNFPGLRINSPFFGADGDSEIYLDTHSSVVSATINGGYIELPGTLVTGPTLTTGASHVGRGVEITANNEIVKIAETVINGTSQESILSAGAQTFLSNVIALNAWNGGSASLCGTTLKCGVNLTATPSATSGHMFVTGGRFGNSLAGNSQTHAFYVLSGDQLTVTGADLTNNLTAQYAAGTNLNLISTWGNGTAAGPTNNFVNSPVIINNPTNGGLATGNVNASGTSTGGPGTTGYNAFTQNGIPQQYVDNQNLAVATCASAISPGAGQAGATLITGSTQASCTLNLPAPTAGNKIQSFEFSTAAIITAMTVNAPATYSLVGPALTTMTAGQTARWRCFVNNLTCYHVQ